MTKQTNYKIKAIADELNNESARSAWCKGVKQYACDLLDKLNESITYGYISSGNVSNSTIKELLLNGASDWTQYSYGGSSLIYDSDIAERLCTPSELKRCHGGDRNPNATETWLDCQARALHQAYNRIRRALLRLGE